MKFMKLGSKPDAFQYDGNSIRCVSSDLATDVTISVGEVKFCLHKFPLLSKSTRLHKLILKADKEDSDEIQLVGFPGGPKAFDICAKFCYGMTVTLNAYNVVAARCAADYLGMTEDVDRGNLIYKIEVFLNTSIFRTWKDTIIVLQTTKSLLPWPQDLNIIGRCIDSLASKIFVDPAKVTWSYTHNRKLAIEDRIIEHDSIKLSVPKDWWVEDICELDTDLFNRVMIAIKSKGRMDGDLTAEALRLYAARWLPDTVDALISDDHIKRNKSLVETIIYLLPSEKSVGCSCSFLLKLLKVAVLIEVDDSIREELVSKTSLKLDQASVKDLLIPARPPQCTVYDVELVMCIVKRFMMHEKKCWDEKSDLDVALGGGSWLNVGGLVDAYLAEISSDPNLTSSSFIELSRLIPEMARPIHDGLYRAVDIYLKEHLDLSKAEKKQICGLMDVKKFTMDASMHASQNERLPLRLVVQVLYFEQTRVATTTQPLSNTSSFTPIEEEWDGRTLESSKSLRKQMEKMKIGEKKELHKNGKMMSKKGSLSSQRGAQLLPSRSRRIFDKLWGTGKGNGESKSSETSGSSQSPTTSFAPGSSLRDLRHSIS